ncbi:Peptidase M1, membrane alanine aminopeptidase [Trichormus variabilis ATCC 29413]|uniref:Aminopeptidase N n=2 Tax=Anabaena variabilis TaxID=264691 RepID=Q3MGE4_TRIV2|nr:MULTISPECIES: M1 family metallopeptidase [Nostocaceae]ABA19942.1 Peptidase M1, membrane alanine aminopeptidase [Trichormus variabilis ATCC 29413]MBC1254148.1 M1 family metallopeptidase [Trichormus variabilis V5]MBC1266498.1 M1 family metallopeptidase [Trichormus variabilis FSR]MBC1302881.1 M1 family metallopeptidase [Trichormus variabilis N2B]MBC1313593.1 M1 family metallopeptidase [Trichormus variabilis PNB]
MPHSYSFDQDSNGHKSFELPGARPHYNPDRPGQVEHIFLDLNLDIPRQSYEGSCSIRLLPIRNGIDRLTLDAVNLQIRSVQVDEVGQNFDYDGEQLVIQLSQPTEIGKRILIAIAYAVEKPQRGIYFIQPDSHYPNKTVQVWTQGEDEDSRFWFPCFDYPGQLSTSEIRVRVPKSLMAISNGELIDTQEDGKHKIYHWSQQQIHPTYLMTLAVADFAEIRDEWRGKPVTYYVEKGREADAKRSMGKTPRMIEFLSEKYGYAYAFPKYAQVCVSDFIFGGMENTSTTLLTDRCLLDERAALDNRNTESLVVHELAHQWFGDLLVIKHWSHAWIKEGMASYSEVMWTEQEYSAEEAAYYRLLEARSYLSEDSGRYRRPMVTHVYREAIELYDRHTYEKGSCVYHMIRAELGEDLFWQAMQTFVQDNAHKTVETIDLLRAIEKATGRNLAFLFDQYVYRGGHPDFKVAYSWDGEAKLAKVTVTQTQVPADKDKDVFDLRIPIGFGYNQTAAAKLQTFTVRVHEREQSFYFPLTDKPDFISFDVGNHWLKTVSLEYPIPELKAQLASDPDPISRIYAAAALAKKGGLEATKALAASLKNEPFWGVRVEVAKQLAEIKLDQAFDGLVEGLADKSAYVRRAVVQALAKIKTRPSYKAVKGVVKDGDASYYVESSACLALGAIAAINFDDKSKEEKAIKLLQSVLEERAGWNEVVRSGAIGGLAELKTSEAALDLILEYTKLGVPQPLRLAAIRALGKISPGQTPVNLERIIARLGELSKEHFFLTLMSVVAALGQMETPKAMGVLRSLADQTADGRVRRFAEEELANVQKNIGTDNALRKLREELDQLKQQNQELKSRLENLEAKSQTVKQ